MLIPYFFNKKKSFSAIENMFILYTSRNPPHPAEKTRSVSIFVLLRGVQAWG